MDKRLELEALRNLLNFALANVESAAGRHLRGDLGRAASFIEDALKALGGASVPAQPGSPSHPSGPSQDSQEAAGLRARIVLILDSYYRDEDVGIAEAADALLSLLSQSPKGAAGARPMKLRAESKDGWVHLHFEVRAGFPQTRTVGMPYQWMADELAYRINAFEAAAPSPTTAGDGGPDRALAMETLLVLACKELIRRTGSIESQGCRAWWHGKEEGLEGGGGGEPSAPKTGLRGAGAPGDGDVRTLVKAAAAAMEDIEIGDLMQWPKGLALVDALRPFAQPAAPGDVGSAGGDKA